MAANIQFLRSTVPHLRPYPHDLSLGTPMVNVHDADPGLYFRSSNGNLLKVGPTHVSSNPPNVLPPGGQNHALCVGEQWLNTLDSEHPKLLTWNGTIWVEPVNTNLVYVQEAVPRSTSVVDGALWFKPSTRELFLRESDTWTDIQRAPHAPLKAIQFNKENEFHGDSRFTYDDALNQLTLGTILFPNGEVFGGVAGPESAIQFKFNNEFSGSPELTYNPAGKIFSVLGNVVLGNPVALPAQTITLSGVIELNGATTIGVNPADTLTVKVNSSFENNVSIGTDSNSTLEVHATSTFNNNVTVGDNAADIFTSVGVARLNSRVEIGLDDSTETVINSKSFIEGDCQLGNNATLSQWYIEKLSNTKITSPQIGQILVHGPGNKWYNEAPGAGPYGNVVEEAPMDGQKYVRQNGAWVVA